MRTKVEMRGIVVKRRLAVMSKRSWEGIKVRYGTAFLPCKYHIPCSGLYILKPIVWHILSFFFF